MNYPIKKGYSMASNGFQDKSKQIEETIYSYIVRDYNSRGSLGSARGQKMPTDLKSSIIYESSFEKCTWDKCDLTYVSGNGCHFTSCDFFACKIIDAAFQHALFDSDVFYKNTFTGSNLAYSTFEWTIVKEAHIEGCAFTGAFIDHSIFQDCTISHSNFELCKFQNTIFKNVDLSNLTLKYVFFENVKMKDVKLPFMQIPYTFGGMQCIFCQKGNIKLVTTNPNKLTLSVKEYKKMLPKLIRFFEDRGDYFPLANCYFSNNQFELAKKANKTGIITSTVTHDFRKLYFFCIQASQEIKISKKERGEIYNEINKMVQFDSLTSAEYREFRHYFPLIKKLMFDNPYNNPTLLISFHTNIAADDFQNLSLLMKSLDTIAENCSVKLDSKHVEIRHNSPNILDWLPIGELPELLKLLKSSFETLEPILSESLPAMLANAANIVAIIGFVNSLKKEKKNTEIKIAEPIETPNVDPDDAHIEIKKLRKNILNQKNKFKKEKILNLDYDTTNEKVFNNKLSTIKKELKKSKINIDMLEVQFLGEQSDVWEKIYNSEEDL